MGYLGRLREALQERQGAREAGAKAVAILLPQLSLTSHRHHSP